ncbi:MAG: homoserine kinase [Terrimicrobiaceae bacterium]
MSSTTVRIPATSANLGPGYDTMGIALQLYNTMTVTRLGKGQPDGEPHAMVDEAAAAFFRVARKKPFRYSWSIKGEVPRSRGLGSSVTVRLGILHGLNDLADSPLDREKIYALCAELEGHPDNAAPAAFGGFTIAASGMALQRYRVDPVLEIVLLIPDFEVLTKDARKVLPKTLPLADAVRSAGHAAAIAGAFASRDYHLLAGGFQDAFHQPKRAKFVPFLDDVIRAGVRAGALGGWLSGSGSAIACVTLEEPERIAAAMLSASGQQHATAFSTRVDNSGVRVTRR